MKKEFWDECDDSRMLFMMDIFFQSVQHLKSLMSADQISLINMMFETLRNAIGQKLAIENMAKLILSPYMKKEFFENVNENEIVLFKSNYEFAVSVLPQHTTNGLILYAFKK